MTSVSLGLRLGARAWCSPLGVALALLTLTSPHLLQLLSPAGHVTTARDPALGLLPLTTLAGSSLALALLARSDGLLERMPSGPRLLTEAAAMTTASLLGVVLLLLGTGEAPAASATLLPAAVAAIHLLGPGLPLIHLRLPSFGRLAAFFALVWWLPALLLSGSGWQAWMRRALDVGAAFEHAASESPGPGAILPRALLALGVALAGSLTARMVLIRR